ncbi:J domain-containing protein [Alkalinema sp. FACHB-956]|uniref:J domain-containing protein n=1 Tax=Alkalinema sp. FACHB-956 TaxID=2692768 RepID=UPI001682EE40|nr:J domain-containing protein [Alkalinema sp. FACHB-956]MBD2326118.1 J domain-containing protein [Alkalinema sp. FACHB-956]
MNLDNCYRVLGLKPGASYEEIKGAYRRLARQLHPDTGLEQDATRQARFIQVTTAYKHLLAQAQFPTSQPAPMPLSPEAQLKQDAYQRLQVLFKAQKFPNAIALVEGLAQRLPQDQEVRQWQALTYHQWGNRLIAQQQWDQGQRYLQKALRTDPHNRSLQSAIYRDLDRLQKQQSHPNL